MAVMASRLTGQSSLLRLTKKKHQRSALLSLCAGNPTGGFPAQRDSNAKMLPFDDAIMFISSLQWWRAHPMLIQSLRSAKMEGSAKIPSGPLVPVLGATQGFYVTLPQVSAMAVSSHEHYGVSSHWQLDFLLNSFLRLSKRKNHITVTSERQCKASQINGVSPEPTVEQTVEKPAVEDDIVLIMTSL